MDEKEEHNRYNELAQKLLEGTISEPERREYLDWLNREEDALNIPNDFAINRGELKNRIYNVVQSAMENEAPPADTGSSKQRKLYWYAAAAAIFVIVAGAAIYFWPGAQPAHQLAAVNNKPVKHDASPGHNGAVLTLANGQQLLLDSLGNGVIATQGKTNIQIRNGQLVYDVLQSSGEVLYNTMTTPKGRQYQLLLPDGSKVWLNAASSITYPVAFTGKERDVTITGEVYFEVAKNKEKPFIVNIDGKASVQALGTSFNINAYADEPDITTTLLEGKVKVQSMENGDSLILIPGQQSAIDHARLTVHDDVDMDEVMAWKNGRFEFNGSTIQSVMRQLSRWYNVDIVYEGVLPKANFVGAIPRNEKLSKVLKMLELTNVLQFTIQEQTATGEAAKIIVRHK